MEVIRAQRMSNSVAGFLRARSRTRSSDLENHRPSFDGQGVVRLSQALDQAVSFRVVPGLPESDASRDPPPLLGRNSILEKWPILLVAQIEATLVERAALAHDDLFMDAVVTALLRVWGRSDDEAFAIERRHATDDSPALRSRPRCPLP